MPLDASHSMMNKFHGPSDANFGLVSSAIKEMVETALKIALSQREGTLLIFHTTNLIYIQEVDSYFISTPPPQRTFHGLTKTEPTFHWPRKRTEKPQASVMPITFDIQPHHRTEGIRYIWNGWRWEKRDRSEICT